MYCSMNASSCLKQSAYLLFTSPVRDSWTKNCVATAAATAWPLTFRNVLRVNEDDICDPPKIHQGLCHQYPGGQRIDAPVRLTPGGAPVALKDADFDLSVDRQGRATKSRKGLLAS